MNLLMVGNGKGSWEMRGQQLGALLGARVTSSPTEMDLRWADLVVLVKRHGADWAAAVRQAGKPIVWDALDFWRQPSENSFNPHASHTALKNMIRFVQPTLTIGATEAMAQACDGVYLPHQSWPGLRPTPARAQVKTVGYDGADQYLGRWRNALDTACRERGWQFVTRPERLTDCDILVAFRDQPYDGWMCRQWKSGVKIVNAIAAGRPLITQESAAWWELKADGTVIDDPAELGAALDAWADHAARARVVRRSEARDVSLQTVAARYQAILEAVPCHA